MLLKELQKLFFTALPIDLFLLFGKATGITHAFLVNVECCYFPVPGVLKLNAGIRPLIGHHASLAENNFLRQSVFCF